MNVVKNVDPVSRGEFCDSYYLGIPLARHFCTGDNPYCCGEPIYRQCCWDCRESLVDPCPTFPWKIILEAFGGILLFGLITTVLCACCCGGSREYEEDLNEAAALVEEERHRRRRLRRRRGLWLVFKLKAFPGAVLHSIRHGCRRGHGEEGGPAQLPTPVPPTTALGHDYGMGFAPPPLSPAAPLVGAYGQAGYKSGSAGGYGYAANGYGYGYTSAGVNPPQFAQLPMGKEDGFPTAPPVSPFPGAPKRN